MYMLYYDSVYIQYFLVVYAVGQKNVESNVLENSVGLIPQKAVLQFSSGIAR